MSLRDQLLAKGLVSKKKARQADQQAKQRRRKAQGNARKRAAREAEEAAARAREAEERTQKRLAERRAREAARAEAEHAHRLAQIVLGNRLGAQGRHRFYHRTEQGTVAFVEVPEAVARRLRLGQAAIAAVRGGGCHVITDKGARKLEALAPELLMHWVPDTRGLSAPEEQLAPVRDWETSLRPHKLRAG